jgi:hypothetical protein
VTESVLLLPDEVDLLDMILVVAKSFAERLGVQLQESSFERKDQKSVIGRGMKGEETGPSTWCYTL